jgi:hypothetical protein
MVEGVWLFIYPQTLDWAENSNTSAYFSGLLAMEKSFQHQRLPIFTDDNYLPSCHCYKTFFVAVEEAK